MKKYVLIGFIIIAGCQSRKTPADLIISGGTIYSMDAKNSVVEAVAVKSDRSCLPGA